MNPFYIDSYSLRTIWFTNSFQLYLSRFNEIDMMLPELINKMQLLRDININIARSYDPDHWKYYKRDPQKCEAHSIFYFWNYVNPSLMTIYFKDLFSLIL